MAPFDALAGVPRAVLVSPSKPPYEGHPFECRISDVYIEAEVKDYDPNAALIKVEVSGRLAGYIPHKGTLLIQAAILRYELYEVTVSLVDPSTKAPIPRAESDGTIFEFKMWPRDVVCLTDPLDPKKQECGDPSNTRLIDVTAKYFENCSRPIEALFTQMIGWRVDPNDNQNRFAVGRMQLYHGNRDVGIEWLKPLCKFCAHLPVPIPKPPPNKRRLVLMCFPAGNINWGPSSADGPGIGGSEEATIFIGREFANLGYHVEIYNPTNHSEMGVDKKTGILWAPFCMYNPEPKPDVFIAWRHSWPVAVSGAKTNFVWLHDTVVANDFPPRMISMLDGIFVLSAKEKDRMPAHGRAKTLVSANGLNPRYFVEGANDNMRFIYASSPDRGLEELLDHIWPMISKRIPGAVLEVYYGFNAVYLRMFGTAKRDSMLEKLKQPGIEYFGQVDQMTLAHRFARAGFWLYPTSFEETSCITGMRAQALGTIPITSRHPDSALPETVGRFDLGPDVGEQCSWRANCKLRDDPKWMEAYADKVVEVHRKAIADPQWVNEYRAKMKKWARETFLWSDVAKQWSRTFLTALQATDIDAGGRL